MIYIYIVIILIRLMLLNMKAKRNFILKLLQSDNICI